MLMPWILDDRKHDYFLYYVTKLLIEKWNSSLSQRLKEHKLKNKEMCLYK